MRFAFDTNTKNYILSIIKDVKKFYFQLLKQICIKIFLERGRYIKTDGIIFGDVCREAALVC